MSRRKRSSRLELVRGVSRDVWNGTLAGNFGGVVTWARGAEVEGEGEGEGETARAGSCTFTGASEFISMRFFAAFIRNI